MNYEQKRGVARKNEGKTVFEDELEAGIVKKSEKIREEGIENKRRLARST